MLSTQPTSVNQYTNTSVNFPKVASTTKEKPINLSSLEKTAKTLEAKATRVLSVKRQTNTARRAAMAENVEANATRELELARTIFRLIEGIKSGETTLLSNIRTKTQVESLEYLIRRAKNRRSDKLRQPEWQSKDRPIELEDTEYVEYPYPWIYRSTLNKLSNLSASVMGLGRLVEKLSILLAPQLNLGSDHVLLNTEEMLDLATNIINQLKTSRNTNASSIAESLCSSLEDHLKLSQIGITGLPSLINALKEYFFYRGEVKADPVKKLERELVGVKIRNYFPTPKHLIEKMLSLADIEPKMSVIEPSAGGGHIADEIRKQSPQCYLSVIEINYSLQEILKAKGYNLVATDFLEHKEKYSRVIMNPPFDKDIEHVQHAYSLLYPKGKIVSIMSEGAFFRTDKKSIQFREWLKAVGGYSEKLPDGSFLSGDRPTGVATRLIIIDKPSTSNNTDGLIIDALTTTNSTENLSENLANEVEESISEPSKYLLPQESEFDVVDEVINQTTESLEKEIKDINVIDVIDINAAKPKVKQENQHSLALETHQYLLIRTNFLEHQENYNRIMMDFLHAGLIGSECIAHVYHGYSLLNPNGSLVAVAAEGNFAFLHREFAKFRNWIKSINGTTDKSPEGIYTFVLSKNTLF